MPVFRLGPEPIFPPADLAEPEGVLALGGDLDARRAQLSARLPIGRVVGPTDIALLAVHLMINTAVTGATYDIDGGEQLV